MEEYLENDDLGVSKEDVEAMAAPVEGGKYPAVFKGLRKNEIEDPETGEKKFLGYVHPTKKGGKKVIPYFQLISDDPIVNKRLISGHVSINMRLFAQLDKHLDIMTGTRVDPDKVEAAKEKVVLLAVKYEDESVDEETGRTYEAKNSIQGISAYRTE